MSKVDLTLREKQIARYAKAIGHPIRVKILEMLSKESCCYHGDMSEILPVAKSTLSQHLKELKDAGLIQGTFTPPTIKYCINQENWQGAKNMFENLFSDLEYKEYC